MKKKFTKFRPKIFSRHKTHDLLRTDLSLAPFKSVIRLGSTTSIKDTVSNGGNRIECNTILGVKNSSNKLFMKKCFDNAKIPHADWFVYKDDCFIQTVNNEQVTIDPLELSFPLIMKHIYGSRGTGNTFIQDLDSLKSIVDTKKTLSNYIFEKYYTYTREYRLHVSANGCFYTCRKMLKKGTPENKKWQRHDDNCVWITDNNILFDKPVNWEDIVKNCQEALKHLNLDVAAFDIKIQSAEDSEGNQRKAPLYIIIESNSAPSFGALTTKYYLSELPKILKLKYEENNSI